MRRLALARGQASAGRRPYRSGFAVAASDDHDNEHHGESDGEDDPLQHVGHRIG